MHKNANILEVLCKNEHKKGPSDGSRWAKVAAGDGGEVIAWFVL
jgi:hypothetical protein